MLMKLLAAGLACVAACLAQTPPTALELRVGDETVPAGSSVQLKLALTDPRPISTGAIAMAPLDLAFFEEISGIALFSEAADVAGAAVVRAGRVSAQFTSGGIFGTALDYPVMTVVARVKAGTAAGTTRLVSIDLPSSFWKNLQGQSYTGTVKPGTITVGGSLSISNVIPGAGLLRAGTVVRVLGTGFDANSQVKTEDPKFSSVVVKNSGEIDLTLAADTEMQGKPIIVTNKSTRETVTYFSYLRPTPMGASARPLLQATVPIFAKAASGGFLAAASSGSYTALALQNANASGVNVTLTLVSASGQSLASASVALASGAVYMRELAELFPGTAAVPAGSGVRVTSDAPIQMLGLIADESAGSVAPVNLTATAPPQLTASVQSLRFNYERGGAVPGSQSVAVGSSGPAMTFSMTQSPATTWLTVSPASGATPATVTVTANPAGLAAGSYTTNLQVAGSSGSPVVIPVTLAVTDRVTPVATAIVSAASQQTGPRAPGQLVTIYGSFPGVSPAGLTLDSAGKVATSLAGVRVLFDGVPAPLIYVSPTQINAVAPYEIPDSGTTSVQVETAGILSQALTQPTTSAAPAIFTADASGGGPAAALNQDFSFNTATPAEKGSVITIYATGEGRTSPPGVTGSVSGSDLKRPALPVTATIGGQPATVEFAGEAPSLVAGVLQVNIRIPDTAPSGPAVPVDISVGNARSPSGVTISIR